MLTLTRKVEQSLVIGDEITITVTEIHDGWVRLGIEAPRDILILREELIERLDVIGIDA